MQRTCDHKIFDETLTLQGTSPNYFSILTHVANGNTDAIEIREFSETNGLTNYLYLLNGMTNWSLSSDGRQINFNSLGLGGGGTGAASFVDGSTMIQPPKVYMATYYALDTSCPLHGPVGRNQSPIQKDIHINNQGRFSVVTGKDKVRQMVLKALLTVLGANTFRNEYGSWISNMVGQKFSLLTQFNVQQSVQDTVDLLIQQQQLQPYIPLDETILRVSSLSIVMDETSDPKRRIMQVSLVVMVGTYEEVDITFGVTQ